MDPLPKQSLRPLAIGGLIALLVLGSIVGLRMRLARKQAESAALTLSSARARTESAERERLAEERARPLPTPEKAGELLREAKSRLSEEGGIVCGALPRPCTEEGPRYCTWQSASKHAREQCAWFGKRGGRLTTSEGCGNVNVFEETGTDSVVTSYYDTRTSKLIGAEERMFGGHHGRWCAGVVPAGASTTDCRKVMSCVEGTMRAP